MIVFKNLKKYYIANFCYNFARTLPHAILTIIFLNKGISVSQIAIIQMMFMVGILLFEFPFGILGDLFSQKIVYTIGLILNLLAYTFVIVTNQFELLCISWFIYGVSAAAMSGSLDSYFVKKYKEANFDFKPFLVKNNQVMLISAMTGGAIGSLVYNYFGINLYYLSIVFFIISILIIMMNFKPLLNFKKQKVQQIKIKKFTKSFKGMLKNNQLIKILIAQSAVFVLIAQTYFQFWQIILQTKGVDPKYFGLIYLAIQSIGIIANQIFHRLRQSTKREVLILSLICITNLIILNTANQITLISAFIVFQISFNLYLNYLNYQINHASPINKLSSVVSFNGMITTIITAIILAVIAGIIYFWDWSIIKVANYLVILCLILSGIIIKLKQDLLTVKSK